MRKLYFSVFCLLIKGHEKTEKGYSKKAENFFSWNFLLLHWVLYNLLSFQFCGFLLCAVSWLHVSFWPVCIFDITLFSLSRPLTLSTVVGTRSTWYQRLHMDNFSLCGHLVKCVFYDFNVNSAFLFLHLNTLLQVKYKRISCDNRKSLIDPIDSYCICTVIYLQWSHYCHACCGYLMFLKSQ